MLCPLDHVPVFSDADADAVAVFEELGFRCSPEARYHSEKYPDARWNSNCIFFENNWIDLLRNEPALGRDGLVLGGCLYRCDDIDGLLAELPGDLLVDRYDLIRTMATNQTSEPERFDIAQLNVQQLGIALALAGHGWPSVDTATEWLAHPNGARDILGIDVLVDEAGPPPDSTRTGLDISVIRGWTPDEFSLRFGPDAKRLILRFRVDSLSGTRDWLAKNNVVSKEVDDGIVSMHAKLKFSIGFYEVAP